jgi:histidine triad (HIT) family protein
MFNHAPPDYVCPFCQVVKGIGDATGVYTQLEDIVYQDETVTAFINARWMQNNPGHVIIIPNEHFENIYDLPLNLATEIHRVARKIALAFKTAYGCDGTSTRQHNEPHGYQEVWHYHLHVFPRYQNDHLYTSPARMSRPEERIPYAVKLKAALAEQDF